MNSCFGCGCGCWRWGQVWGQVTGDRGQATGDSTNSHGLGLAVPKARGEKETQIMNKSCRCL